MIELAVDEGTQVTLHFALHLSSGETVDSTFDQEPATFTVGDGNFLPGFESVLMGMKAGERDTFVISAEDGFGHPNPDNVQTLNRAQFAADVEVEKGLVLSFNDKQHGEIPGVVADMDEETITVDFNHPLAGRDIHFEVKIITVEPATKH